MATAAAFTLLFVVAEALAGWRGHSLALLSDAGHNLTDVAALGLSWYGIWIARKGSHEGMTFGYHRVAVFAALVTPLSLVAIAIIIGWEAVGRLFHPEPAQGGLMIVLASGGHRVERRHRVGAASRLERRPECAQRLSPHDRRCHLRPRRRHRRRRGAVDADLHGRSDRVAAHRRHDCVQQLRRLS